MCTLGFHLPIGFVALSAGLLLAFVNIKEHKTFIGGVSWSTVLLVAGMITYVSLLQHVGVIDTLAEMALALGAPLLIALVLCYVIGVGSAFASSTALLTAFIPMAGPLLATSSLSASGTVAALAIAATVVDVSPFSTDGALVVANARDNDRQRVYRQLMMYAGASSSWHPRWPGCCWCRPGLCRRGLTQQRQAGFHSRSASGCVVNCAPSYVH